MLPVLLGFHGGPTGRAARAAFLFLILALFAPRGVVAQEVPILPAPKVQAPAPASLAYAPVRVQGRPIFEVAGDDQLSARERAERIARRLEQLIAREQPVAPFRPEDVVIRNGRVYLRLGGETIMEVTQADAADALASPRELALTWGGKLSAAVLEAREARANPLAGIEILVRNSFRDLLVSAVTWLPRLAGAFLVWVVFWILARFICWIVRLAAGRTGVDPNLRQLARAVAYYGTWAVGLVAILSALGFESTGIVTALGVTGFVLGFAFKDILSHFLAGIMLLLGRQFRIGDQIVVNEHEGTVEEIQLRAMHLRTYDNRLVIIPNAEVFTSAVISNTASPFRRGDFVVGIGYDCDIERAQRVAVEAARSAPGVRSEPEPFVLVDELAPSTVNLRVWFYSASIRLDFLKVRSACIHHVKEAFDREGISMPTEIRTLVLENSEQLAESLRRALPAGGNGSG